MPRAKALDGAPPAFIRNHSYKDKPESSSKRCCMGQVILLFNTAYRMSPYSSSNKAFACMLQVCSTMSWHMATRPLQV